MFEYIVLICPTYAKNKTYRNFAQGDRSFIVLMPDASNQDEINELLDYCITLFSGTNTLIALDDCAVSQDLKKRSNIFIELAFSGRRFHNPSQVGTKTLFDDYGEGLDVDSRNT